MNSTFKVVFNKARGALMVVNEVTLPLLSEATTVLHMLLLLRLLNLRAKATILFSYMEV